VDTPEDLRRHALAVLDEVAERSLPAIVAQLEAPADADEAVPLDAAVLASVWPQVAISMRVPEAMPAPALRLFNSVVVEAVVLAPRGTARLGLARPDRRARRGASRDGGASPLVRPEGLTYLDHACPEGNPPTRRRGHAGAEGGRRTNPDTRREP
jgi:hypothetical protein